MSDTITTSPLLAPIKVGDLLVIGHDLLGED